MAQGAAWLAAVSLISESIHTPFFLYTPAMSDGEEHMK